MNNKETKSRVWWKHGVIYCIYPRSFYDHNNDGIGDIKGIIDKLDYLVELGIDAIWLTPIYKSPLYDYGYDVEDFIEIDESYGTKDDFLQLLAEAHARDIKVIMDLILNHTSFLHEWFIESRSSKESPKRDWYLWEDPLNGKPPNNWRNVFGGSAWEFDKTTGQYYFHSFLKEQPDLNWRNNEMKKVFFEDIRYWLDLGVDGFRLDSVNMIIKDEKLRNNPGFFSSMIKEKTFYTRNQSLSIEILKEFRKLLDEYKDKMSIGEIYALPPGDSKVIGKYLSEGEDSLDMAFDFSLIYKFWSAKSYYRCIKKNYEHIPKGGWLSIVLSNHDLLRNINRIKWRGYQHEKAKVTAVLLLTLKGTPFLYYGEELGMKNTNLRKEDIKDPIGKKYWPFFKGRDQSRTPMQWDTTENAGFSRTTPWLPVNKDYRKVNYANQKDDDKSMYNLYKTLISLRKSNEVLQTGEWEAVIKGEKGILAYNRKSENEIILVILNFTNSRKKIGISDEYKYDLLLSTHKRTEISFNIKDIVLKPFEAIIARRNTDIQI